VEDGAKGAGGHSGVVSKQKPKGQGYGYFLLIFNH